MSDTDPVVAARKTILPDTQAIGMLCGKHPALAVLQHAQ